MDLLKTSDNQEATGLKSRTVTLFSLLAGANVAAWIWAFTAFHNQPMLLGTAFLAWVLGLRHAVDPDHIAAIDNVTRKLMAEGQKPVGVGCWFALGHSTVVVVAAGNDAEDATSFAPAMTSTGRSAPFHARA